MPRGDRRHDRPDRDAPVDVVDFDTMSAYAVILGTMSADDPMTSPIACFRLGVFSLRFLALWCVFLVYFLWFFFGTFSRSVDLDLCC